MRTQLREQAGQPFGPEPNLEPVPEHVHPLDQEPDDPRLLGGEQLIPDRAEVGEQARNLARVRGLTRPLQRWTVRAMISGAVSRRCTCATTAASTSPAGTLVMVALA